MMPIWSKLICTLGLVAEVRSSCKHLGPPKCGIQSGYLRAFESVRVHPPYDAKSTQKLRVPVNGEFTSRKDTERKSEQCDEWRE
jgi:hypothetical protein